MGGGILTNFFPGCLETILTLNKTCRTFREIAWGSLKWLYLNTSSSDGIIQVQHDINYSISANCDEELEWKLSGLWKQAKNLKQVTLEHSGLMLDLSQTNCLKMVHLLQTLGIKFF